MAMFSRRPASLAHLSDETAARALSKHFGNIVEAAKELGVDRKDLRRLTWSNPAVLDAAHERMSLFVYGQLDEIISGLNSRVASVRRRAADRLLAHPMMLGHPFAGGLSLLAPAARARGPRSSSGLSEEAQGRLARERLEREAAAELAFEGERERALADERERERVEVMVERRPLASAQTESLWPSYIRRPTRGMRR